MELIKNDVVIMVYVRAALIIKALEYELENR